jgi:glycosyltransferase involved in cell wall biosynthesis
MVYSAILFPCARSRRVLSTTHHSLPFRRNQILTVHDLRPYHEPDSWLQAYYFRVLLPSALRRCDGILTVSEASRRELVAVYGVDAGKIFVVPNAVEAAPEANPGLPNPAGDGVPYLLMVGATWKHKNAMEVLAEHNLWRPYFRLIILAGEGQYSEKLKRKAADLGIVDRVGFLHSVSDAELAMLYRGCSALVYPSRMEGFGLPPLEALAYGKPAIVSDIPVFRELLGDVPYFVELGNSSSWERALSEVLQPESASRAERRRAGRALAAQYSREKMCVALTTALEQIWRVKRKAADAADVSG